MESAYQETVTTWLKEAFKDKKFDEIKVEFPNFDTSGGYVADMLFATVKGTKNGREETIDVVVKRSKDSILQNSSSCQFANAYTNEINIYSKIVPYFQKFAEEKSLSPFGNISHCYGTISEAKQYVIILDNLKKKGFKVHDLKIPMDMDHVNLVVDAYAKWHALSFAIKDQQPQIFEEFGKCNKDIFVDKLFDTMLASLDKELDFIIEMYKEKNKPNSVEKLEWMRRNSRDFITDFMHTKNEDYFIIRHGDCWNNNFLFHYNDGHSTPDKVVVIDWQLAILGSPLLDITQFLFYGCSKIELVHLDDILLRYHNALSKRLRELGSDPEKCFPWKICSESFRRYALYPIAGVPLMARMCFKVEPDIKYDVGDWIQDGGNSNCMMGEELRDTEGYFNRIDGVLELCIERGLI